MICQQKNYRNLYHRNYHLIEKPVITFKNPGAYQNYLGIFWKIRMLRYCFYFCQSSRYVLWTAIFKNSWTIWGSFTFIQFVSLFLFHIQCPHFIKFMIFSFSNSVWLCAWTLCFNLYWSLVNLYCWDSFKCTAKWMSLHIHISTLF